jgi:hypothetical protein
VTLEIAQLAGRVEGEQSAKGIVISLPDLLIGVTALHLGYSVATFEFSLLQIDSGAVSCSTAAKVQIRASAFRPSRRIRAQEWPE